MATPRTRASSRCRRGARFAEPSDAGAFPRSVARGRRAQKSSRLTSRLRRAHAAAEAKRRAAEKRNGRRLVAEPRDDLDTPLWPPILRRHRRRHTDNVRPPLPVRDNLRLSRIVSRFHRLPPPRRQPLLKNARRHTTTLLLSPPPAGTGCASGQTSVAAHFQRSRDGMVWRCPPTARWRHEVYAGRFIGCAVQYSWTTTSCQQVSLRWQS